MKAGLDVRQAVRRNGRQQSAARLWVVGEDDQLLSDARRDLQRGCNVPPVVTDAARLDAGRRDRECGRGHAPGFGRRSRAARANGRTSHLAALRGATGTSRKYVVALLEDLGRRGILTRTPAGHVPGPRAARAETSGDGIQ